MALSIGGFHLWTDQMIPGPVSCRCPEPRVGLMETLPRWHTTKYNLCDTEVEIAVTLSSHVRLLFVFI